MATDQISSIISTLDLAEALEQLVRMGAGGTLHVACRNALSRYRFAMCLANVMNLDSSLIRKTTYNRIFTTLGLEAKRSLRATLAVEKAETTLKRRLPSIRESLIHMRETGVSFSTTMGLPYDPL
jgi:dTDP-4-dehydrorhamnose reductase